MRKVYLLITAALLIGNLSVFAEVIATVGSTEFDTESYEGSTSATLRAALYASSADNKAILQKNFILDNGFSIGANKQCYLDMNGKEIEHANWFFDVYGLFDVSGTGTLHNTGTKNDAIFWIYGGTNPQEPYNRILNIGKNVTLRSDAGYGVDVYGTKSGGIVYGYGVEVNINGNFQTPSGITINGSVNQTTGNVPIINIGDDAIINGVCSGDYASIYAAGYGIWNIGAAVLKAATPVYAKSGNIIINGATIEACGAFAEPVPYSNGFHGTGDAIMIDSHESYAGDIQLTVLGNTIVTSANGYALQEALTLMDQTKAIGLTISGGAFEGGKGSMKLSDEFAQALADGSTAGGNWTLNAVTAGKYATKPVVVADDYVIIVTSDAEYPYTIQKLSETTFITKEEITEDKAYDNLEVGAGKQLIIKTGTSVIVANTTTIGTSSSYPSQIIVEPGATFTVGTGGVVENNNLGAESLILQADKEHGTGKLLYNGTTVNANPLATVELYLKGKNNQDGTYVWQHFGIPMDSNNNAKIDKTMAVMYNAWDVYKGWVVLQEGGAAVLQQGPWIGFNTTTNAVVEGGLFKFKGNIVGNVDNVYQLGYGYNCFANSYTAPMSIKSFTDAVKGLASDGEVWIYDNSNDTFDHYNEQFYPITGDPGIASMQAFFIQYTQHDVADAQVNYNSAVYGFDATRGADASINGGRIYLSAEGEGSAYLQVIEGEQYSDEIEPGDGDQMETGKIQIYVEQSGHKLASMVTNNLEGKEITIVTKGATEYTLSFANLVGNAFKLTDMASGAEIEVGADKNYTFTAAANSTIKRFKLGEGEVSADEAEANSAVNIWAADGNVFVANNEAAADIEIYNLSGVKVAGAAANGEALQAVAINSLASGVYIVRVGEASAKVVK